jgi:hypothetical protein
MFIAFPSECESIRGIKQREWHSAWSCGYIERTVSVHPVYLVPYISLSNINIFKNNCSHGVSIYAVLSSFHEEHSLAFIMISVCLLFLLFLLKT